MKDGDCADGAGPAIPGMGISNRKPPPAAFGATGSAIDIGSGEIMDDNRGTRALQMLHAHADVRDAVVIDEVRQAGRAAELVAVVLPGDYCNGADLRDALIASVGLDPTRPVVLLEPDPDAFAAVQADPAGVTVSDDSPYVYQWREPDTELERSLCAVVSECLGRARTSLSDNFVGIGGDSMTAIKVVSRLDEDFGVTLPLESLFEVESIADLVDLAQESGLISGS
jgi:acyl carrier protein